MSRLPHYVEGAFADPDSYVRRTFDGELVQITPQSLADKPIPVESKTFLEQVGLPCSDECLVDRFTLSFEAVRMGLHPLRSVAVVIEQPVNEGCADMLCLDVNIRHGRALCIAPDDRGAVYDIALQREGARTFVNSCVEKLGVFLAIYVAYCRQPDETATNEEARGLVVAMQKIDPRAFAQPENWWASVGEDLESDVF
jgi:hypothetical protein